jgi:hypothetical protein
MSQYQRLLIGHGIGRTVICVCLLVLDYRKAQAEAESCLVFLSYAKLYHHEVLNFHVAVRCCGHRSTSVLQSRPDYRFWTESSECHRIYIRSRESTKERTDLSVSTLVFGLSTGRLQLSWMGQHG